MRLSNRTALLALLSAATVTVMAGSIIAPAIALLQGALLGADESNIRYVITTHALFIAIFSPIFGSVIDKIGAKKPFVFGLLLYGVAGFSGFFITDIGTMLLSRVFLGIAVAAITSPMLVLILNAYKGEECNKIMGWLASGTSLGGVVWPLLGGVLGIIAWNLPFAVYLAGIPIGLIAWLTVPETHNKEATLGCKIPRSSVSRTVRKQPIIFAVYGLGLWSMVLLYTNVTFIPQLLASSFGITGTFNISLFIGVMGVAAAISALFYRKIKSKITYKAIALVSLGLWAVGFLLLSQITSLATTVASIVVFGVGQGIILPALNLWVGGLVDASVRGRMISYLTTFLFIGQFLPPVVFNPIFSAYNFQGVFLTAGAISTVLAFLFIISIKKSNGSSDIALLT